MAPAKKGYGPFFDGTPHVPTLKPLLYSQSVAVLDRLDQVWTELTRTYDEHPAMFVGALVAAGFLLRLAVTPFNTPVDVDVFAYMVKAVEIDRGDWTPVRSHAIGWSILMAPVLAMVRNLSALTLMNITRVAASV